MSKKKDLPLEDLPVTEEWLDYWIDHEVGGSGLSLGIQARLKSMAREIRSYRQGK